MKKSTLIVLALLTLPLPGAGSAARPREPSVLPFGVGEVLSYRAVSSRFGTIGTGSMRVEPAEGGDEAGSMMLAFDFSGRVGPFRIQDRTRSWVGSDPLHSLRYERRERSPLRAKDVDILMVPAERRWESRDGQGGQSPADPLDELSFLYFVRTLPLRTGDAYELARHFDSRRSPVAVRVLSRQQLEVPAGRYSTILLEMQVNGDGILNGALRLHLTDDAARLPVRIESSAPWVGRTSLLLESVSGHGR